MLLDAATLKKSSEMDPSITEYIQNNPAPTLDWANVELLRTMVAYGEKMTADKIGTAEAALSESYLDIPMRDGTMSNVKIIKPASPPAGGSPLIVLSFGGGFICGSKEQLTPAARAFARAFGAVVVNLSYRLAPEHKFPTSNYDCFDSAKWLAANAAQIGADPTEGFVVGGVSAGGNTSAALVRMAQEEPLAHPITGQWLAVPTVMDKHCVPEKFKEYHVSRDQNAEAPILDKAAMAAVKKFTEWDNDSPMRYPILAKGPVSEIPPAYFQVDGMDPLRDDGLIYEEVLKEAGVKTKIDFYPGCPHAHWGMYPGIEVTTKAIGDTVVGMGWLLGKDITHGESLKALAGPDA